VTYKAFKGGNFEDFVLGLVLLLTMQLPCSYHAFSPSYHLNSLYYKCLRS